MNVIEEKYKEYCKEKLQEIKDQDLPIDIFFFETFNDVRICYHEPISGDVVTMHVAHSYASIYVFLLGILYATDLCRNFAKFSIYECT